MDFNSYIKIKPDAGMGGTVLPCGCILEWGGPELQAVFCFKHTEEYVDWKGSEIDFLKKIATPKKRRNKNMRNQVKHYSRGFAQEYI